MRSWSVVIPSDNPANLEASACSVMEKHRGMDPARITVVTGSIKRLPVRLSGAQLLTDARPFSFPRRVNMGILQNQTTDIVVMGDDVLVETPLAFDLLMEEAPLRVLAASVRGRVGPWWQKEGQNHPEVPFVSFTCVYLPRDLLNMVGLLEEGFPGYGYEDTDFCIRTRRAGLSCGVSGGAVIEHTVSLTSAFMDAYGDKLWVEQGRAEKAFMEKWRRGDR
jgi:GT2 family glycosyltransferase